MHVCLIFEEVTLAPSHFVSKSLLQLCQPLHPPIASGPRIGGKFQVFKITKLHLGTLILASSYELVDLKFKSKAPDQIYFMFQVL